MKRCFVSRDKIIFFFLFNAVMVNCCDISLKSESEDYCGEIIKVIGTGNYSESDKLCLSKAVNDYVLNKKKECPEIKHIYIGNGDFAQLWSVSDKNSELRDKMSYYKTDDNDSLVKAGRWLLSFSLSKVTGDYDSFGISVRAGSLLYRGKYDISIVYDKVKYGDYDYSYRGLGLSLRRLYRVNRHGGYNLGMKYSNNAYGGDIKNNLSAIGGMSVYVSGGSFDFNIEYGTCGRIGANMGYTIYVGI